MPEARERLTARKIKAVDLVNGRYYKQEGFEPNYVITPYGLRASRVRVLGTVVDTYVNDDESYGAVTIDDGSATLRAKFFQELDMMEGIEEGQIVEVIGKVKQYDGEMYVNPELVVARGPEEEILRALDIHQLRETWQEHVEKVESLEEADRSEDDIIEEMQGEGLKPDETRSILAYLRMDDMDPGDAVPAPQPQQGGGQGPTMEHAESTSSEGDADDDEEDGESPRKKVVEALEELDEGEGADYGSIEEAVDVDEDTLEDAINDLLSDGTCYEPRPGRIKQL